MALFVLKWCHLAVYKQDKLVSEHFANLTMILGCKNLNAYTMYLKNCQSGTIHILLITELQKK